MSSSIPTTEGDEPASKNLQTALGTTFSASFKQHLQRCLYAVPPVLIFYRQTANLNPYLRFFTNCTAIMYYPCICLVTSLSLSPLLFLKRQTNTLQSLLTGILDTLVSPLRHIKSPTLDKVSETMSSKSDEVLKEERWGGRKVVLWMMVKVVKKVLDLKFGEVFKEDGVTAESLGKVAGRELIGLVVAPVEKSLMISITGVVSGAIFFGAVPFILLRLFGGWHALDASKP